MISRCYFSITIGCVMALSKNLYTEKVLSKHDNYIIFVYDGVRLLYAYI